MASPPSTPERGSGSPVEGSPTKEDGYSWIVNTPAGSPDAAAIKQSNKPASPFRPLDPALTKLTLSESKALPKPKSIAQTSQSEKQAEGEIPHLFPIVKTQVKDGLYVMHRLAKLLHQFVGIQKNVAEAIRRLAEHEVEKMKLYTDRLPSSWDGYKDFLLLFGHCAKIHDSFADDIMDNILSNLDAFPERSGVHSTLSMAEEASKAMHQLHDRLDAQKAATETALRMLDNAQQKHLELCEDKTTKKKVIKASRRQLEQLRRRALTLCRQYNQLVEKVNSQSREARAELRLQTRKLQAVEETRVASMKGAYELYGQATLQYAANLNATGEQHAEWSASIEPTQDVASFSSLCAHLYGVTPHFFLGPAKQSLVEFARYDLLGLEHMESNMSMGGSQSSQVRERKYHQAEGSIDGFQWAPRAKLFGYSIEETLLTEKQRYSLQLSPHVPLVFSNLLTAVLENGAMHRAGVFVEADNCFADAVDELRAQLEEAQGSPLSMEGQLPEVCASTLKLWLRMLPESLIPSRFFKEAVMSMLGPLNSPLGTQETGPGPNKALLQRVLAAMSSPAVSMLRSLAEMFELISLKEEVTGISAHGLAMEFGPMLFRPTVEGGEGNYRVQETMQLLQAGAAIAGFIVKLSEHLLGRTFYVPGMDNSTPGVENAAEPIQDLTVLRSRGPSFASAERAVSAERAMSPASAEKTDLSSSDRGAPAPSINAVVPSNNESSQLGQLNQLLPKDNPMGSWEERRRARKMSISQRRQLSATWAGTSFVALTQQASTAPSVSKPATQPTQTNQSSPLSTSTNPTSSSSSSTSLSSSSSPSSDQSSSSSFVPSSSSAPSIAPSAPDATVTGSSAETVTDSGIPSNPSTLSAPDTSSSPKFSVAASATPLLVSSASFPPLGEVARTAESGSGSRPSQPLSASAAAVLKPSVATDTDKESSGEQNKLVAKEEEQTREANIEVTKDASEKDASEKNASEREVNEGSSTGRKADKEEADDEGEETEEEQDDDPDERFFSGEISESVPGTPKHKKDKGKKSKKGENAEELGMGMLHIPDFAANHEDDEDGDSSPNSSGNNSPNRDVSNRDRRSSSGTMRFRFIGGSVGSAEDLQEKAARQENMKIGNRRANSMSVLSFHNADTSAMGGAESFLQNFNPSSNDTESGGPSIITPRASGVEKGSFSVERGSLLKRNHSSLAPVSSPKRRTSIVGAGINIAFHLSPQNSPAPRPTRQHSDKQDQTQPQLSIMDANVGEAQNQSTLTNKADHEGKPSLVRVSTEQLEGLRADELPPAPKPPAESPAAAASQQGSQEPPAEPVLQDVEIVEVNFALSPPNPGSREKVKPEVQSVMPKGKVKNSVAALMARFESKDEATAVKSPNNVARPGKLVSPFAEHDSNSVQNKIGLTSPPVDSEPKLKAKANPASTTRHTAMGAIGNLWRNSMGSRSSEKGSRSNGKNSSSSEKNSVKNSPHNKERPPAKKSLVKLLSKEEQQRTETYEEPDEVTHSSKRDELVFHTLQETHINMKTQTYTQNRDKDSVLRDPMEPADNEAEQTFDSSVSGRQNKEKQSSPGSVLSESGENYQELPRPAQAARGM
eukprot:g6794.t1